jgi:hypothetical protein
LTTPVTPDPTGTTDPGAGSSSVTVTTDKSSYQAGDAIQVTVEYTDPANPGTTLTVTATVTASDGSTTEGTAQVQVGGSAAEPLNVSVSDSFGGAYTQQSNDAGTAVFTGTVGTPPAGA